MKRILSIVVALAAIAPLAAHAENTRMSDGRYLAASRCLAYADLPELHADQANFSGLRTAVGVGFHGDSVVSQARDDASRIRATAHRLGGMNQGLEQLRGDRNAACSNFVAGGLVQLESSSAPS